MQENDFLRWIAAQTPPHARVPLSIGDDMALVRLPGNLALLKTDQCLDQVHFDLRRHTVAQAGKKAVNRCLSDCAAMACLPAAIMVAVALPRSGPGSTEDEAKALFLACRDAAAVFDCPLVGGDTAVWDQRLAITVSALGMLSPGQREIRRGGGGVGTLPGDTLFVSGALGGSLLPDGNGRHLTFTPRVALAQKLAAAAGPALHAMMDLSDGLAQDLPRLCRGAVGGAGAAVPVGATIHADRLPIHPDAEVLAAQDGIPAGLHALADGEDYELLFALETAATPLIVNISQVPLTAIGTVTASPELLLRDAAGQLHPWPRGGWEHGASRPG